MQDHNGGAEDFAVHLGVGVAIDLDQLLACPSLDQHLSAALFQDRVVEQSGGDQERQVPAAERHERPNGPLILRPELLGEGRLLPHATTARLVRGQPWIERERRKQDLRRGERRHHQRWDVRPVWQGRQVGLTPALQLRLRGAVGRGLWALHAQQHHLAEGGELRIREAVDAEGSGGAPPGSARTPQDAVAG